jgi:hypothetical protein
MWQHKFSPNYSKERGSEESLIKAISVKTGNVALFDIDVANLINCGLYKVNNIDFKFSQQDNPYVMTKYYDKKPNKSS